MSLNIGAILATLSLDNSGFKRGILEASAVTSTFGTGITTFLTNPVLGAISALKKLYEEVKKVTNTYVDHALKLDNLSKQTGIGVEKIQAFQIAFENMGSSADTANTGLLALTQRLGEASKDGGALVKTFQSLGVAINTGDAPEVMLNKIIDGLAGAQSETVRLALSTEAFGRNAGAAYSVAFRGGVKELDEVIAKQKQIKNIYTREDVDTFLKADDNLDFLKNIEDATKKVTALAAVKGALDEAFDANKIEQVARKVQSVAGGVEKLGEAYRKTTDDALSLLDAMTRLDTLKGWDDAAGVLHFGPPKDVFDSARQRMREITGENTRRPTGLRK